MEDQGRAVTDHVVVTPEVLLARVAGEVPFAAGDELLTESRAAELFGVSLRTLQAWRRQGTAPGSFGCRAARFATGELTWSLG